MVVLNAANYITVVTVEQPTKILLVAVVHIAGHVMLVIHVKRTKMNNQNSMLALAIQIAADAHVDQSDRSGKPYILHAIRVMDDVRSKDPEVKQIAVLHDVVEDTSWTIQQLSALGFSDRVIDALELLTHDDAYDTYIEKMCTNRDAMLVKMADLRHNSDITRLKGVSDKDLQRIRKYHNAYTIIKTQLKNV